MVWSVEPCECVSPRPSVNYQFTMSDPKSGSTSTTKPEKKFLPPPQRSLQQQSQLRMTAVTASMQASSRRGVVHSHSASGSASTVTDFTTKRWLQHVGDWFAAHPTVTVPVYIVAVCFVHFVVYRENYTEGNTGKSLPVTVARWLCAFHVCGVALLCCFVWAACSDAGRARPQANQQTPMQMQNNNWSQFGINQAALSIRAKQYIAQPRPPTPSTSVLPTAAATSSTAPVWIPRFHQYSGWIANVVGRQNHGKYYLAVTMAALHSVIALCTWFALLHHTSPLCSPIRSFSEDDKRGLAATLQAFPSFNTVVSLVFVLMTLRLALMQWATESALLIQNLTAWEALRRPQYLKLRPTTSGSMESFNPFDSGSATKNMAITIAPDWLWYALYGRNAEREVTLYSLQDAHRYVCQILGLVTPLNIHQQTQDDIGNLDLDAACERIPLAMKKV